MDERLEEMRLGCCQPLRPEAVAIAGTVDIGERPFLDQDQRGKEAPPRIAAEHAAPEAQDPPIDDRAVAQHGIDMLGNRTAILDAGKAMTAEIGPDDIVGSPSPAIDFGEQLDRRLKARAGSHRSVPSAVSRNPPADSLGLRADG